MEQKQFLISKEDYLTIKATWKKQPRESWEHIVYNILRSKDLKNGFTEKTKNIQGNNSWYAYNEAKRYAIRVCSTYKDGDWMKRYEINFKNHFGIDKPEGFFKDLS